MALGEAPGQQVRIQLSTQHEDLALPEDTGAILVPTSLRRQDLSTLVNDLLSTSSPVPFEFFIDGYPLRTSIEQWLTSHRTSAESTLSIEYHRAQQPPEARASFPHDDWIGAVDVLSASSAAATGHVRPGQERILSASYDGCVRVWNMSGVPLATSEGAGPADDCGNRTLSDGRLPFLHAAKFLSPSRVVASGWRMYLRTWEYEEGDAAVQEGSARLKPVLDLHGHTMPVNSIDVHPDSGRVLSASDDCAAKLWTTDKDAAPDADEDLVPSIPSAKRRKVSTATTTTTPKGALSTLSAHKSPVKGVVFHPYDPTAAYTASSDSSLITWDLETARTVTTRLPGGPHVPLRTLCTLPRLNLLAAGTVDRRVLLVDPREGATRSNVGALRGHRNAITALDAEPGAEHGLASASLDGCVRVWDVRAARDPVASKGGSGSTFKIPRRGMGEKSDRIEGGEGVKVLGMRWDADIGIVSGGEDKQVQIDRVGRS